ncbi:MAG: hypothetical protein C0P71_009365 [Bacillota bacterium]
MATGRTTMATGRAAANAAARATALAPPGATAIATAPTKDTGAGIGTGEPIRPRAATKTPDTATLAVPDGRSPRMPLTARRSPPVPTAAAVRTTGPAGRLKTGGA